MRKGPVGEVKLTHAGRWRTIQSLGMADVRLAPGETFEGLLRRFNRQVQQDRILAEIRRRKHYEKPSEERRRKAAVKRRKSSR